MILILPACANETRTIPTSVSYNTKFKLVKINPDRIRFAFEPVINNNQIIYESKGDLYYAYDYYAYDINTGKTSKSSAEIYKKAKDEYHDKKYGAVVYDGLDIIYKDPSSGETVLQTSDYTQHIFGIGKDYIVWSESYVGGLDKIHVMKLADRSVKNIVPSQEFITTSGYYKEESLFEVSELGVYQDKIIVQTMYCIYMYNAETLQETKIICDEHFLTPMRLYDNKIVVGGNSGNRAVNGYVNNDAFLVEI